MNQLLKEFRQEALLDPLDTLLADVAIRIQLSATDYGKVQSRNRVINDHLERESSLLRGYVNLLYPQGSMAVGATIASRLRTDEFDIDVMAELALPADTPAQVALDLLFHSVRGERGSRYYDVVERRARCVTIHYADGMHIDLTPSVLWTGLPARTSVLFHHKPEEPHEPTYRLLANPWGFAEWFKAQTPLDHAFGAIFAKRAEVWESEVLAKRADSVPVPAQQGAHEKSKAVIVLQLLKRWRNAQYDRRNGRRPPSVMMAKLVADAANHTETLFQELELQARHMRRVIGMAHDTRQKVHVINPRCEHDTLTDRWPASLDEQELFVRDLERLIARLVELPKSDLGRMRGILTELFGENPTGAVFESYNRQLGQSIASGRSMHLAGSGRVLAASAGLPARAVATPMHTFFGRPRE
jgi:SMODS domain-containing protein